jgi:hypothetical protein
MICWFHKRILSRSLDANATPPTGTLQHLRHCATCSAFYETQTRIVRELVASAESSRLQSSPWLERRIIAELRQEPEGAGMAARRFPSGWPIAVAAACLLLGAFLWLQHRPVPDPPVAQSHPGSDASTADLASLFDLPNGADLSELSRKLNWPLETEMQLVVTDAKTAMNYLADSFLPEPLRQAAFNESTP